MLSVFLYTTNVKRLTFHTHLRNTPQATIQVKKSGTIQGRDKRPLYIQAISAITEMIKSGGLGFGSQLPLSHVRSKIFAIDASKDGLMQSRQKVMDNKYQKFNLRYLFC